MKPQATIQNLIEQAQGGERVAFDSLLECFDTRLERIVRKDMGRHLRQEAELEDVLQEVRLRAFASIDRFRYHNDESFPRWLAAIARHVVLEVAGKHERGRRLQLKRDVVSDQASPSRIVRREERFDRLDEAVQGLSPVHREVILLARIEGLPIRDIAARMNRSENAVLLLLSRALKKLKETLVETESLHLPDRRLEDREANDGP